MLSQLKKWTIIGAVSALIVSMAGIPSVSAESAVLKTRIEMSGFSKENRYIVSASAAVQKILNVKFAGQTRNIIPGHTVVHASKGKISSVLKSQRVNLGTVKIYPDAFVQTPRPQAGAQFADASSHTANLNVQSEIVAPYIPGDEYFEYQWSLWPNYDWETPNFYGINLVDALDSFEEMELVPGDGVNISIIDTGITEHPDLDLAGGADFTSPDVANEEDDATGLLEFGWDNDPSDPGDWCDGPSSWHGTHVHGTIGAMIDNGVGVAGIAPGANIVHARALGTCGGYTSDIAAAIVWSAGYDYYEEIGITNNAYPADVINMSLGGGGMCDPISQEAINMARAAGAMVVVAAGNSFMNASMFSPASCKGVMTVASSGSSGERASYSNYDFNIDITAPGGDYCDTAFSQWAFSDYPNCLESYIDYGYDLIDLNAILSTINTGETTPDEPGYAFYNGTSMATPHVVGVYALLLSINPDLAPEQAEAILKASAAGFGDIAYADNYDYLNTKDDYYSCSLNAQICGVGLLDAAAAVQMALETEGSDGSHIDRVDITVGGDGRWGEATVEFFMPIGGEWWSSLSRVEVQLDLPGAKPCRVTARNINWYTDSMSCTFKKLKLNKEHRVLVTGVYGKTRGMTQEYFFAPVTLPKAPTIKSVSVGAFDSGFLYPPFGFLDGIASISLAEMQIPALAPTHVDDPLVYVEAYSNFADEMWNFCSGYYMTSCEIPYLIPGDKVKFRAVLMTVRGKVTSKWTKWYYVPNSDIVN